MNFIDTHSHIDCKEFNDQLDELVIKLKNCNVTKVVIPNIDENNLTNLVAICNKYSNIFFPTIGIHPTEITKDFQKQINFIKDNIKIAKFIAIGEIGLDTYWNAETLDFQIEAFKQQIDLSIEHNLPLIIHCRNANDILLKILEEKFPNGNIKGVLHCFSGGIQEAKKAISLGLYIGIGGVITFKNAKLANIVAEIGIDSLVLETDAPYLAPVPYRGKTNSPEYIPIIAKKVAEMCNIELVEVAKVTTKNAEQLFNFNL